MTKVTLHYRSLFGFTRSIDRNIPASWDDLSEGQLVYVFKMISTSKDLYLFRTRMVKYFFRLSWFEFLRFNTIQIIESYQFIAFLEADFDRSKSPFAYIKGLKGPKDELLGFTSLEFMLCDHYYQDYRSGNDRSIHRLMAVMYRPGCMVNGRRLQKRLDPEEIEGRAWIFQSVNPFKCFVVLRYWERCRRDWEQTYNRVFTEGESDTENYGWPEVFLKMAESGTFGTLEDVESSAISNVFLKMQIDSKDYEQFKIKNQV